jgi:Protein of unknown function (DUF1579)
MRFSHSAFAGLLLAGLATPPIRAQQPTPAEMEAAVKRIEAAATPGEAHRFLNNFVGSWTITSRLWTAPGAPPLEGQATSGIRWIMDGRFIQDSTTGVMMGQPLVGHGLMGYDNLKQKYTGLWIDNHGTAMLTMEGSLDQEGKVLTMFGEMNDPISGEMGKQLRYVYRVADVNNHVFEIHDMASGAKVLEMTYSRR